LNQITTNPFPPRLASSPTTPLENNPLCSDFFRCLEYPGRFHFPAGLHGRALEYEGVVATPFRQVISRSGWTDLAQIYLTRAEEMELF
jgi:hypothetical protein